jgi:type VI secretion system secreted protein Hcp
LVYPFARIGRRARAALLVVVGVIAGGAALAVAGVPDTGGVIHGCFTVDSGGAPKPPPNFYVIDPGAGQSCKTGERTLDWSAQGPSGPQGPRGLAGRGLTINTPLIKPTSHVIGHIVVGSAKHRFGSDILGLSIASSGTGGGSGAGAGKVHINEFTIQKKTDKASPLFFKNCVAGAHYKKVTLTMRKAGGSSNTSGKPYLVYTFSTVFTTSFQQDSSGKGKSKPVESISFNFEKVSVEYLPQ